MAGKPVIVPAAAKPATTPTPAFTNSRRERAGCGDRVLRSGVGFVFMDVCLRVGLGATEGGNVPERADACCKRYRRPRQMFRPGVRPAGHGTYDTSTARRCGAARLCRVRGG